MPKIFVNGKEYDSPDDMPPEVRQVWASFGNLLDDKDNDGVPDIAARNAPLIQTATTFVVDGKAYQSLDEVPPEARQRYEQAMAQLDANRDGIPDMLQGGGLFGATPSAAPPTQTPAAQAPQLVKVVGEGPASGARTAILIVVVLVVAVIGVVVGLSLAPAVMP